MVRNSEYTQLELGGGITYGVVASIHSASCCRSRREEALHSVTTSDGTASHHRDNIVGFPKISKILFSFDMISMATTNEFAEVRLAVAPASDAKR